jgi:hypothetical protein
MKITKEYLKELIKEELSESGEPFSKRHKQQASRVLKSFLQKKSKALSPQVENKVIEILADKINQSEYSGSGGTLSDSHIAMAILDVVL